MFDVYKKILFDFDSNSNQTNNYLLSGALAGMSAAALVYPLDLTKTILAINLEKHN